MVRKIISIVVALIILTGGYMAFKRLNFWQRSVQIFSYKSSDQRFEGMRSGRGVLEMRQNFPQQNQMQGRGNQPDSLRSRFEGRGQGFNPRPGMVPDSLRRNTAISATNHEGANQSDRRFRDNAAFSQASRNFDFDGRGGRGNRAGFSGSKIYLKTVWYFLVVFAAFTVLTIYIDKFCRQIFRKRNSMGDNT